MTEKVKPILKLSRKKGSEASVASTRGKTVGNTHARKKFARKSSQDLPLQPKRGSSFLRIVGAILRLLGVSLFFIIAAALYIATIKGVPGNPNAKEMRALDKATKPFELSPERGRYAHTYALAVNGSFSLTPDLAEAVYPDVGYVDGRFYSFFAPGISILAVPFFKLGSMFNLAQVATFSVISVFALGVMFFLYRIGRDIFRLSTANALLAPLLFGFGSTSWSYATTLYQHHLTTFFILSAFYAVWRFRQKNRFSFLWATYVWAAYALAFTVDYPNLLLMLPVMMYFFLSSVSFSKIERTVSVALRPAFLLTVVTFLAITFLHGYYNQTQLGAWTRLSGNIVGYKTIKEKALTTNGEHADEIAKLQNVKGSANFFREEQLPRGFETLTVAPDKGLFIFSPLFLLGIAAIVGLRKRITAEVAILLATTGTNIFLYSSFGDPWGGWAFGPRYLILSMAVLSLLIGVWLSGVRKQFLTKLLIFVLFAFSSAVSLIGVLTTNAVPPKVEADYLHMKYGYLLTYDYFINGSSSSFLFNTYVSHFLTLQQYFLVLYLPVLLLLSLLLLLTKRKGDYAY